MNTGNLSISQNIAARNRSFADFAYAGGQIIERFRALAATLSRWEVSSSGQNLAASRATEAHFELPLTASRRPGIQMLNRIRRARPGDAETLRKSIAVFASGKLIEHLAATTLEPRLCQHWIQFDENSRRFLHFLFRAEMRPDRQSGTVIVLAILEECVTDTRPSRFLATLQDGMTLADIENAQAQAGHISLPNTTLFDLPLDGLEDLSDFLFITRLFEAHLDSLSFLPPGMAAREWLEGLNSGFSQHTFPWSIGSPPGGDVLTATISIDLRKSTSLMQLTDDRKTFAIWLEGLSEICRKIVHDNQGIFDKFTGDGVIAHFATAEGDREWPEFSSHEADKRNRDTNLQLSIQRAFTCGCELIRALDIHLDLLRPYLRFDIGVAGPAVGIAHDRAFWALDRDGRPVVVGRGVVDACRLTCAPAGRLLMANNMKRHLMGWAEAETMNRLKIYRLKEHKELRADLGPSCLVLENVDHGVGRSRDEMRLLVKEVAAQVGREHEERLRPLERA